MNQCLVCLKEGIDYINNKVANKELSHFQAAKELDVSLTVWIAHYEGHVRGKIMSALATDIVPFVNNMENKIMILTDQVTRLRDTAIDIHTTLKIDRKYDGKTLLAWTGVEKALTGAIKELALFSGDIKEAASINIQQNIIQVESLVGLIMEQGSPELKQKVIEFLESRRTKGVLHVHKD